jgi:glycosyltransferase involved in cell wall biosynthesis
LKRENPVALIVAGFSPATFQLWCRSWFDKTPYLIWSGAVERKGESSTARGLWRRMLASRAAGFIAYGSAARDYLLGHGAPARLIHIGINTVDLEYFRAAASALRDERGGGAGGAGQGNLLFIGHLSAGKRLDLLLAALAVLRHEGREVILRLVGDGPQARGLRSLASKLGVAEAVMFEGFKQQAEIPAYLARAGCFVFPSEYDIWGLALVEAMAAGLPCVASPRAGATRDLIQEGVTGLISDFQNPEEAAGRIRWVLDNPREAAALGRRGQEFLLRRANLQISADGFVSAIKQALGR